MVIVSLIVSVDFTGVRIGTRGGIAAARRECLGTGCQRDRRGVSAKLEVTRGEMIKCALVT